jgi:hypothetical protein
LRESLPIFTTLRNYPNVPSKASIKHTSKQE